MGVSLQPPGSGPYATLLAPAEVITPNPDGTVASVVIGGVTYAYTYNGDGSLATESDGATTRHFAYDGAGNLTGVS